MVNPILEQAQKEAPVAPVISSNLQAVQEALEVSSARITGNIKQLEASTAKTQVATDVITSAIEDITAANLITARAKNTADLQAQNATIDTFEASGGTETQVTLMQELKADGARVATLLDEKADIVDDEHTGIQIIDNIINSFSSLQLDQNIVAAKNQENQTKTQIASITGATESFARINTLTKKTLNEASIEANYKAIEAEGAIKGAQATIQNLHSNATAMSNLANADSRNVSNLLAAFRLEGEAQERALQVERRKFQREQMAFSKEKWLVELPAAKVALERATLSLEDAKGLTPERRLAQESNFNAATKRFNDLVETELQLVESVQKAQSLAGAPIEDRETIIHGLQQRGELGAKYNKLLEIGGSTDPVLGSDAFEAKTSVGTISPSGNFKETAGTKLIDQITIMQEEKYAKNPKGAPSPSDKETLKADFNATAKELTEFFSKNIQVGDASNPFQAPPMSVITQHKNVNDTALFRNVLEPMNMQETDPQKIMDAAVAGVIAKNVTPEEAAIGVEAIFDTAALLNNTTEGGFRRVGLPNQTTFNTVLKRGLTSFEDLKRAVGFTPLAIIGFSTRNEKQFGIDLMNGSDVQKAIVILMSGHEKQTELDIQREAKKKEDAARRGVIQ